MSVLRFAHVLCFVLGDGSKYLIRQMLAEPACLWDSFPEVRKKWDWGRSSRCPNSVAWQLSAHQKSFWFALHLLPMTRFPEKVSLPRNGIGSQWLSDPPLGMAVTIRACHMHRCSGPQKIPVQDFYGGNNFRESEWPTPENGGKTVKVAMHKHKIHITVTNPPGNGGNRTPGHLHKLMAHPGQRCHVWCSKCFSLLLNC